MDRLSKFDNEGEETAGNAAYANSPPPPDGYASQIQKIGINAKARH